MSWYFAAGLAEDTVYFSDKDIADIIAMNLPGDRYGIEQEIQKRIRAKRPDETIFVHVYSLDPLIIDARSGNITEGFWKDY